MQNQAKKITFVAVLLIGALFLGFSYFEQNQDLPQQAKAQISGNPLKGWAWSSNIGWVSFNAKDCDVDQNGYLDNGICNGDNATIPVPNYEVQINPSSGDLSDYAWSSSIGWIRFDPTAINSAPEAPYQIAQIDIGTDLGSGWARACGVFQSGCSGSFKDDTELGGWDGWIRMAGSWADNPGTSQYEGGVRLNGDKLEGFAWGGDVVGWLNFDPQSLSGFGGVTIDNLLSCSFDSIYPIGQTDIKPGQLATLSWTCTNANSCILGSNDPANAFKVGTCSSGSVDPISGNCTVGPVKTTTYTLDCTAPGGFSTSPDVDVEVGFKPTRCEVNPRTGVLECP